MTRLRSTLIRTGAIVALIALVVGPPVLVAALIGRPYPDWSTLTNEIDTGRVSADTVMRIAALLFVAIWIWIVAIVATETYRVTVPQSLTGGTERKLAIGQQRRLTFVHRLVRVALLGTVTTAATVSSWSTTAIATPSTPLAASVEPPPAATAPADPSAATVSSAAATTTIIANGRDTPLSIAVDLGDETLRDDIIAMNRSADWAGGVFPDGMPVTIPIVERAVAEPIATTTADMYVVQPNDGMWNVAEALLGDGARHHELGQLLAGQEVAPGVVFTPDTAVIHPGWTFRLPSDAPEMSSTTHVVLAGDTLSGIAAEQLGDERRWPDLWDLNARRTMPDGRTFDDPDFILPGWHIELPTVLASNEQPPAAPTTDEASDPAAPLGTTPPPGGESIDLPPPTTGAAPRPSAEGEDQSAPPTTGLPSADPTVTSASAPIDTAAARPAALDDANPATDDGIWTDVQRSVWPKLVVGTLLTAGLAAAVGRLRNRRLSRLMPGRRLPEPTSGVAGTEQALLTRASRGNTETINALLRSFTPHASRLPQPPAVRAVQLGTARIEVLLANPEPVPPRGWATVDGGHSWTHTFGEGLEAHRQLITPALVTIGTRTDANSDEVLLDLETAGSVAIVGDRAASLGLARSMVLELATYPLGVSMDISLVGLSIESASRYDRVRANVDVERALDTARRRCARRVAAGNTIVAARADLDDDDGSNDPHVIVIDVASIDAEHRSHLDEVVALCSRSSGTAVVLVGGHADATERIKVDASGSAWWSGVELRPPDVPDEAEAEIAALLDDICDAEPEPAEADDFMSALLTPAQPEGEPHDALDDRYEPPQYDVLIQLMGEPRAHGVELSADQTELLALLTCLRHRTEIHIGLVHEAVGPDRARKTIENRMSQLRRALDVGSDGHDLLPEAAPGRGGRSHYLVSPLVLTDLDLLEHRYHAAKHLSSGEAIEVLRDGLELMRGPLFRARRGFDFWPHSEGVVVRATNIIQSYACRLVELAAEADDPALVLRATTTSGCVLDNPLAEFPIRQAEQAYADASGNDDLLASVERARRKLLDHIDNDDTFAEAG